MKEQTRRNILRYGIAIDLVILATGVGMIVPPSAPLLITVFAAAVALSAWRGGWQGALTALVLSVAAFVGVFPESASATNVAMFAAAGVAGAAIVMFATRPKLAAPVVEQAEEVRATGPVAVPPLAPLAEVVPLSEPRAERQPTKAERKRAEREAREAKARAEREEREAKARAERDERERRDAERREAEAARERAESEARAEREREEAIAREREEAERREAEAKAEREREEAIAREREEAERVAAEAARQREEAERVSAEAARQRAEAEAERERVAREAEEAIARQREEAERVSAEAARQREEAERVSAEAARQRAAAEAERERVARDAEEAIARQREEAERVAAEAARQREEAERVSAEAARQRAEAEAERERVAREAEEAIARQRAEIAAERERIAAQHRASEELLRVQYEQQLAAERERFSKEAEERIAAATASASAPVAQPAASKPAPQPEPKSSLLATVTSWFRREERPRTVNLNTRRVPTNNTATRRPQPAGSTTSRAARPATAAAKPRVLLIEKRRGTADTIGPKLKHRGVEMEVVERWVDAVDEIFRFKPHVVFLDTEHPEFERMHRTVLEKSAQMPIVLTGRSGSTPPSAKRSAFVGRPYDVDEVVRIAQSAQARPEELLTEQLMPRAQAPARALPQATMVAAPSLRAPAAAKPVQAPSPVARVEPIPVATGTATDTEYEIVCFNCRAPFNALDADWCSCLAKERTMVCTNCLTCFCKAPPAYKEKFWVGAPPRLFERKSAEGRTQGATLRPNPARNEVKRPLVLCVEDDEEIQVIVQRVCANLEYGFLWATNGQDGLELARDYRPNLILSDAFMPKLDGREMCRLLKEDPTFADTRMVVMTGLYTDTKYRSEAVKRFHVDDYVAKPVAITDLINLLQKHLEGVTGLPIQEDLYELHRQNVDLEDVDGGEIDVPIGEMETEDVALSEMLAEAAELVPVARPRNAYDVCCFNCQQTFDATHAEWCSCVGRDNTLNCPHCSGCFCKAPAAYRERFWIDAPPSLFERKMIGSKRNLGARHNPAPAEVKRPLILLVEDDENVQLIVRTVVSNMGYGFVVGADGQEGLTLAREYGPDMILSDAFMPKLDGREMCRLLKEDPNTSRSKAVIMTGLYTDRKYRNEALDYFKVDDYVAKPLAVDDLIKLFKKHLPQEVTTAH